MTLDNLLCLAHPDILVPHARGIYHDSRAELPLHIGLLADLETSALGHPHAGELGVFHKGLECFEHLFRASRRAPFALTYEYVQSVRFHLAPPQTVYLYSYYIKPLKSREISPAVLV